MMHAANRLSRVDCCRLATLGAVAVLALATMMVTPTSARAGSRSTVPNTGPQSALVAGVADCQGNVTLYGNAAGGNYFERVGTGTLTVHQTYRASTDPSQLVEPWTWNLDGNADGVIARFALHIPEPLVQPRIDFPVSLDAKDTEGYVVQFAGCDGVSAVSLGALQSCSGQVTVYAQDSTDGYLQSTGSGVLDIGTWDPTKSAFVSAGTEPWAYAGPTGVIAQFSEPVLDTSSTYSVGLHGAQYPVGVTGPPANCSGVTLTSATQTCSGSITITATDGGTANLQTYGSGTFTLVSASKATSDTEPWAWSASSTVIATVTGLPLASDWLATFVFGSTPSSTLTIGVGEPASCAPPPPPPSPLGATYAYPAVVQTGSAAEEVAYEDVDGSMWAASYSNGSWQAAAPAAAGSEIGGGPSLVSTGTGTAQLFWLGQDANLWTLSYASGTWSNPQNLGSGPLLGSPVAVAPSPATVDVFWQGRDGNVWYDWYTGGSWRGPQNLTTNDMDFSAPIPVVSEPGVVDVFWEGRDRNLWHVWSIDGTWYGPQSLGAGPLGSAPEPVATTNGGVIDVFWRGMDGNLWHDWYVGAWYGPQSLGSGPIPPDGTPHPASPRDGTVEVFWQGTDGGLWYDTYALGWSGPRRSTASAVGSWPVPLATGPGVDDVFWIDSTGQLWHDVLANGSWGGQQAIT